MYHILYSAQRAECYYLCYIEARAMAKGRVRPELKVGDIVVNAAASHAIHASQIHTRHTHHLRAQAPRVHTVELPSVHTYTVSAAVSVISIYLDVADASSVTMRARMQHMSHPYPDYTL